MHLFFNKHWYDKINYLSSIILLPLSWLFYIIVILRRWLYKRHIFKSYKLPVPVVIVGNISVGGTGKTPLCKYLAQQLNQSGIECGIILRGYKSSTTKARIVTAQNTADVVGDEALIYARNNIKVAIGANRYQAGLALLKAYPEIKLIIADDGLQHYKLCRDYEIAVIDGSRVTKSHYLLPMGPYRETYKRLTSVNAVVVNLPPNAPAKALSKIKLLIHQNIILDKIYNPVLQQEITLPQLRNMRVIAMTAIGNPAKFFDFLRQLDIPLVQAVSFSDHYFYTRSDIPHRAEVILVSEKDYVKLSEFNCDNIWVVTQHIQLNDLQLIQDMSQLVQSHIYQNSEIPK